MKNRYTFLFVSLFIVLFYGLTQAQVLFTDDFSYTAGTLRGQGGWVMTGTASTTPAQVIATSLSYATYAGGSGVGGSVQFNSSGEDDNHPLSDSVNSGSVYAAFLLSVTSSPAVTGDYFVHFADGGSFNFFARTEIRSSTTNGFDFGIMKTSTGSGGALVWTNQAFTFATTYLVVVKYTYNTSSATDDAVSLFVNPDLSGTEPTPLITTSTGNDFPFAIKSFNIRQGSASTAPIVIMDGVRVGRQWLDAILPVELTSFTAAASSNAVNLKWSTATEIKNNGFGVERSTNNSNWVTLGFVSGNGNSNSVKNYSYTDNSVSKSGKYYYRLKQVDNDGSYKYTNSTEVNFVAPSVFALNQNYPNPFNPSTIIAYSVPTGSNVKLTVYNAIGQAVSVLENGFKEAGVYNVTFNASNLPSGLYFYKLEAGQFSQTRKMMLVK